MCVTIQVSSDGNVTSSILSFQPARQDNGKVLVCRASNELVKRGMKETSMKLNIFCKYIYQFILLLLYRFEHHFRRVYNIVETCISFVIKFYQPLYCFICSLSHMKLYTQSIVIQYSSFEIIGRKLLLYAICRNAS